MLITKPVGVLEWLKESLNIISYLQIYDKSEMSKNIKQEIKTHACIKGELMNSLWVTTFKGKDASSKCEWHNQ